MLQIYSQLQRPVNACTLYRGILPSKFLSPILREYGVGFELAYDLTSKPDAAAVIIQRHISADLLVYFMDRQNRGLRVAADWDDDMLNIPNWSPAYLPDDMRWEINALRMIADRAFVTTGRLKKVMESWTNARQQRVAVLPNLMDLSMWRELEHPEHKREIRIAWAGSGTHGMDLALLTPVLEAIFAKYKNVNFFFFGEAVPPQWLHNWFDRITHYEYAPLNQFTRHLQFGISPHIGLCPLINEPFNFSKSGIKAFEYTLAGAAVVASPLPPYQCWQDPLWKFATTTEEWIAAISELIEDHEQRQRMHGRALEVVARHFSWQHSEYVNLWAAAMLDLVGYKPGETPKVEEKPSGSSGVAEALKRMKGGN